ncbi:hypothetical protein Air01nite_79180 [Asanoa iriomotensis]|uniref:Uncharacterized protein n=1 Tax=Asanoa iriomotensis TaxID=234613 RepID=A0ABQ4CGC2_9ACTN|nr:hypothetical protein Air01nite_79180 [Asanoa iriomotensis]
MADGTQRMELRWVFRPMAARSAQVRALDGRPVFGIGQASPSGETDIVLTDGTCVRASRKEVVAE